MKLTTRKKLFLIISLAIFIVLLFNSNTIFAAINTEYSGVSTVTSDGLDDAMSGSTLIGLLAKLIYAVGRLLEWLLGIIFKLITGTPEFPWADKIVFNSVPLLDINFINPATGSFVGNTSIQDVLKDTYTTILTLAASFFGIVVLITAIKLVISTIASEKAKYKQAIVDWLVGFVMLFCMHYAISFIFYLNEQLVVVASKIVTSRLEEKNAEAIVELDQLAQQLIVKVEASKARYDGVLVSDILKENKNILNAWLSIDSEYGVRRAIFDDWDLMIRQLLSGILSGDGENEDYKRLGMIISWAADTNISVARLMEIRSGIKVYATPFRNLVEEVDGVGVIKKHGTDYYGFAQALRTEYFTEIFYSSLNKATKNTAWDSACGDADYCKEVDMDTYFYYLRNDIMSLNLMWPAAQHQYDPNLVETTYLLHAEPYNYISAHLAVDWRDHYYLSRGASEFGADYSNGQVPKPIGGHEFYWTQFLDDLIILKSASPTASGDNINGVKVTLMTDLAQYFKYNAYSQELSGGFDRTQAVNSDNAKIQNMIMYAILVAQSLILFISYIKRLFYVILLAMMAPVVVVFDFFQKFGK